MRDGDANADGFARPVATGASRANLAAALRWLVWGVSAALMLTFLAQPVGTAAQLALCGTALAGMVVLWLAFPRHGAARMGFLALGTTVVIRYVYWRTTATLPGLDDPVGFGLGLVLLGAELYCFLIFALSLIINAAPLERAPAPVLDEADLPAVDVFVPSYNEPTEILAVTLAAARNLDYPQDRVNVWLLDDGGTDQKCADADPHKAAAARARRAGLQALCVDLGIRYVTRARNEHAKAGNLNGGLLHARSEIVLVLDADHAPFRSLLRETVGLFSTDAKLFLVQTPHVFLNPDPVERNLRTFATMPSENEMFYAVTQAGLDKWNGSFFCGSAALLRRAALDEVGGFSGITITEDCETAFELHARGWTSAYVDRPLIAGLQPETYAAFIGQRARWCQGMFQIMLLKNPLTRHGLTPIQRLGYLSSMTFWFFPIPRLIFMLAPLLHIFFDVKIFVSSIDEALAFTATYVVANLMIQNYLYGHVRWPWISELYEYVQGVYLARSIGSVLVSPRKPSFAVTAKGANLDRDQLSPLAWPFFAIFAALAAGCATAAWRYLCEPGVTDLMLVVGLWCLFNLVIAGAALGVVAERRQPERSPSLAIARTGRVCHGATEITVAIERVSAEESLLRRTDGGVWPAEAARCTLAVDPVLGGLAHAPLSVRFERGPTADRGRAVFEHAHAGTYRALADLMYGDAAPLRSFLAGRRRHRDLLTGSLRFLAWGIAEPIRAMSYALRPGAVTVPAQDVETATVSVPIAVPEPILAPVDDAAASAVAESPATVADAAAAPALAAATPVTASDWTAAVAALAGKEIPAAAEDPALDLAEWLAAIRLLTPAETAAVSVPVAVPEPILASVDDAAAPAVAEPPAPVADAAAAPALAVATPVTASDWTAAVAALAGKEIPAAAEAPALDPAEWLAAIRLLARAEAARPIPLPEAHDAAPVPFVREPDVAPGPVRQAA